MHLELNKIYQGDCLELMKELPDKSIDLILCDLPYGVTACKWDMVIPFDKLWENYHRIVKANGVIALTGQEPFASYLRISNIKNYKYDWIWDKVAGANFFNLSNRPFGTHETISIFSLSQNFTFNPIRVMRTEKSLRRDPVGSTRTVPNNSIAEHYNAKRTPTKINPDGKKHPISIIKFSRGEEKRIPGVKHPTRKPVALFEYLIKTYTNEGNLVLDNCIGSGTTALACLKLNRNFIGMEKEPKYIEIANKRIKEARAQIRLAI